MRLWFRSRKEARDHCNRHGYLEYDYQGRGIRPKESAVPLAEGIAIHRSLDAVLQACCTGEEQAICAPEVVEDILIREVAAYKEEVRESGFGEEDVNSDNLQFVIDEQVWLLQCLVWAVYRCYLPGLLQAFELVAIEREETWVAGCTCGIGDGIGEVRWQAVEHSGSELGLAETLAEELATQRTLDGKQEVLTHEGRLCRGIVVCSRPDWVAVRKATGQAELFDWKTTAYEIDRRESEFQIQLCVGALGFERRTGVRVLNYTLVGLVKGKRDYHSKVERENGGLKKQGSVLCYPWHKAADGVFGDEVFSFTYTKAHGFGRIPMWEHGGFTPRQWVLEKMPVEVVQEQLDVAGPFAVPHEIADSFLTQVVASELEWGARLANVEAGAPLDSQIFQSWDCYPFRRACTMLRICKGEPGLRLGIDEVWKDERFEPREPHHQLEKERFGL